MVDDIEENRDVLKKLLVDVGIDVIEAINGQDALNKYRDHHPDMIFMDIQMPVTDGVKTIRRLKEDYSEDPLKIVINSESALKHERERYDKLGCAGIVLKPFQSEQIYSMIHESLGVEFEYEEIEITSKLTEKAIDYTQINLPEKQIKKVKAALELYNITQLDKNINMLET